MTQETPPFIPPKIRVYYIPDQVIVMPPAERATGPKQPVQRRRFVVSSLLVVTLFFGLGGGLWLGWSSRFGIAEQDAASEPPATQQQNAPGAPIPLQFDQSDLTVVANLLPILIEQNRHEPTPEENRDTQRKQALQKYLAVQKSPLANDDGALDALLRARNMKMILAISFVESNICKHQINYNCSGIGGSQLKKYENFASWIDDFDSLLEKRYKDLPVEKFIGYYVQPGSQNWIDGVYQILGDLGQRHIE